jgi:hypothetical protein
VRATLVAFTVTPLSVLVPLTKAHIFTLTADDFTVAVWKSEVFDDTVTVVVCVADDPNFVPFTVMFEPLTFVTDPNANPPFPLRLNPPAGGVRLPVGEVPPFGRLPPRPANPLVQEPFTAAEIVIRVAATTPLLLRAPVAITHAPTFRLDRGAASCSVILAEPAEMLAFPDGLSDVVIVNVVPFTAITGPNNDPWTGAAALAAAGTRANAANAAMTRRTIIHLRWSCCLRRSRWRLRCCLPYRRQTRRRPRA